MDDLIDVLSRCPYIYELSLSTYGIYEIGGPELELMRETTGRHPTIRSLSLQRCGVQSLVLYQLLGIWPQIQFLRLDWELAASPPPWPIQCKLYELVLGRTPPLEILEWLLSASDASLRIAEFRDFPGSDARPLLARLGPQLRSLRLMCHTITSQASMGFFTSLEELVLYQVSNFVSMKNLPRSIEHISFRCPAWAPPVSLDPIISAMNTLPKLRMISCDKRSKDHRDFPALVQHCRQRNVVLSTDALPIWIVSSSSYDLLGGIVLIQHLQPDDPVVIQPSQRLPRRKSISNIYLMHPLSPT